MDYKDRIKDSPLSKLNLTLGKTEPRPAGSALSFGEYMIEKKGTLSGGTFLGVNLEYEQPTEHTSKIGDLPGE